MILKIIGLIIGALISGAGIYYLIKEKNDSESKKIYGITTLVGIIIVIVMILLLIL
ncbi:hypothetical protein [Candidatus Pseudoruminococcus sp.]|uniref:hypothetical protein n=1 Tax=Candidatus Pseudoruminococcus sp. TaxID=3101048 RepID=UPI00399ACA49|nr:hypothetical protein [Ruminococcus sp.]